LKTIDWLVMITNNRSPYLYDIPLVLSLPKGFTYRFRYTERWLQEKNIKCGVKALIVLRNYNTAKLYPIRNAIITKVEQFGPIRYIEFSVRNFVAYTEKSSECQQKIKEFTMKVKETLKKKYKNAGKTDMSPLVFLMEPLDRLGDTESEYTKKQEHEQWSSILKLLSKMRCYSDLSFLKIESLKTMRGDEYTCKKLKNDIMGYKIPGGKTYILHVLQSVPYDPSSREEFLKPHNVELQTEEEILYKMKSTNYIVGKYDYFHFIFKTGIFVNDIYSYLEIINHQSVKPPGMLPIQLSLVVEIGKLRRILRWFRMAAIIPLALVFVFANHISCLFQFDVNIIRNIAILGLALCIGGLREILARFPKISIGGI